MASRERNAARQESWHRKAGDGASLDVRGAMVRWSPKFALAIVYFLVAAAAFNGYYAKHGFYDDSRMISARMTMDGSAIRPVVYRRLNPLVARFTAERVPESLKLRFWRRFAMNGVSYLGPDIAAASGPDYFLAYNVLYYLVFAQLLAALFVLRALFCRFVSPLAATLTPMLWALAMPYIQAVDGGLLYDYAELLFLACAALAALDRRIALLVLWTLLGTFNKETFLLFIPSLVPLLVPAIGKPRALVTTSVLMAVSAAIVVAVMMAYAGNGDAGGNPKAFDNLLFYLNPFNLLRFSKAYGLLLPRAGGILGGAIAVAVVGTSWRRADLRLRRHLLIAAAINVPIFLAFAAPGEVRNLSLCFVGFSALVAYGVDDWIRRTVSGAARVDVAG